MAQSSQIKTSQLSRELKSVDQTQTLALAKEILQLESSEIDALAHRLDHRFSEAVSLILQCKGRVVVSGMGKSGHIGGKIASTLASTGTPAFFYAPGRSESW